METASPIRGFSRSESTYGGKGGKIYKKSADGRRPSPRKPFKRPSVLIERARLTSNKYNKDFALKDPVSPRQRSLFPDAISEQRSPTTVGETAENHRVAPDEEARPAWRSGTVCSNAVSEAAEFSP